MGLQLEGNFAFKINQTLSLTHISVRKYLDKTLDFTF